MDRYALVAARFSRRRLLAIVVSFLAAFAFIVLGGSFSQREAIDTVAVGAVLVFLIPLTQTIALRRALAPVRRALIASEGDASRIVGDLRALPPRFVLAWLGSFVVISALATVGGNILAGADATLRAASGAAMQLAGGDLATRIEPRSTGDFVGHAGDHGRGFAVVADEIRGLATRAARANAEIAAVIGDVQKRTGNAVASTREGDVAARAARDATSTATRALASIRTNVGDVARRLDEVGRANEEQRHTTDSLVRATTAVREQAARNRGVAEALGALAAQLARAATEGANASSYTRERVAALVRAGEDVSDEAAALADLTGALRTASMQLNAAIARFHDQSARVALAGAD